MLGMRWMKKQIDDSVEKEVGAAARSHRVRRSSSEGACGTCGYTEEHVPLARQHAGDPDQLRRTGVTGTSPQSSRENPGSRTRNQSSCGESAPASGTNSFL